MKTRALHRVIGLVMLLPMTGWAITGAVFFLKPGYQGAYEILPVKTYLLSIEGEKITTDTGVKIEMDWNRLALSQRGKDTDRIDTLYKIHYLQWTGVKSVDNIIGALGIVLVLALSGLGARLFFIRGLR